MKGGAGAVGAVLLCAVLFGTTGTTQALAPEGATSLSIASARLVVGGLALLAVLPLLGGHPREVLPLWRTPSGVAAGVFAALYQVCFFAAVAQTGVAVGTLVTIGLGPVLAGLLALLLLGERATGVWLAATGLCLAGLVLLVGGGEGGGQIDPLGVGLALVSAAAYAGYTVIAKRQLDGGHRPATVMASAFGLGGLVLVPVLLTQPTGWLAAPSGVALALYLGLVTITLGYLLFVRGLSRLPAGPVTTLMLAEPVVATLLGVSVLDERLSLLSAVGVGLLLLGLLLQGLGSRGTADAAAPDGALPEEATARIGA